MKTWIAVANASCARIFTVEAGNTLEEIQTLVHAESRLHTGDLVSDKTGRSFQSAGSGSDSMDTERSQKEQEAMVFAKQVAEALSALALDSAYERGFLASSPSFLGLLRKQLDKTTAQQIQAEVDKDLTSLKPEEIREHFPFGY